MKRIKARQGSSLVAEGPSQVETERMQSTLESSEANREAWYKLDPLILEVAPFLFRRVLRCGFGGAIGLGVHTNDLTPKIRPLVPICVVATAP